MTRADLPTLPPGTLVVLPAVARLDACVYGLVRQVTGASIAIEWETGYIGVISDPQQLARITVVPYGQQDAPDAR